MSLESNLSKLPETCYTVSDYSKELIQIKRGVKGYFASPLSALAVEENRALADKLNAELGVSKAQEQAMFIGSMFGWHVPGADPDMYEKTGEPSLPETPSFSDEERGYSLNNGEYYFYIQTCDDGYDYTIYRRDFSEYDGGQLDEPDFTMDEAVQAILEEFGLQDLSLAYYDPDEISVQSELAAMQQADAARSELGIEPLYKRLADAEERSAQHQKDTSDREVPGREPERF